MREVEASLASERATVASLQEQITGHKWFIDRYMDQWFTWSHRMARAIGDERLGTVRSAGGVKLRTKAGRRS